MLFRSTSSRSLLKLMSIELVMPSSHFILCCPLLFLSSIFPSIRVFSIESVFRIRWPKYWSFSVSPSNEYSGLISIRMDWLDLPTPQFKSINSSALSFLYSPTLNSHPYMTTGKTIALIIQSFVGKVMSLLFNTLSRLDIVFLPRNKHLLISWLQSSFAVFVEPKNERQIKSPAHCVLAHLTLRQESLF